MNVPQDPKFLSISHFISGTIRFVRVFGGHPITLTRSTNGARYHYEFQTFTWATAYSVICVVPGFILLANWVKELLQGTALQGILEESYLNLGNCTGKKYYDELDQLTKVCLEVGMISVSTSCIYYTVFSLASTSKLIRFLNGTNHFENMIRHTFPMSASQISKTSLTHLYNFRKFTFFGNAFIFWSVLILHLPSTFQVLRNGVGLMDSKLFFLIFTTTSIAFIGVVDDTKVLLILKIVQEYFRQITLGVEMWRRDGFSGEGIDVHHIRSWRRLIHFARTQAKLAVGSIQHSSFCALVPLYLNLTTAIYLVHSSLRSSPDFIWRYAVAALVICGNNYVRLYFKALIAEGITQKENQLAQVIRLIELDTISKRVTRKMLLGRVEMNFITDPMIARPSQCRLENSVSLNLPLLLGIFHNVSTYAVALIQMDMVQAWQNPWKESSKI